MRKMTWMDWVAGALVLLVPLAGWLTWRSKPREKLRARRARNRTPPGPQIRR